MSEEYEYECPQGLDFGDQCPSSMSDHCPIACECINKRTNDRLATARSDAMAARAGAAQSIKNPYRTQVGGAHYLNKHDLMQFCIENKVEAGEYSVMKYVYRHEKKDGMKDLRKAQHELQMIAYSKYGEEL